MRASLSRVLLSASLLAAGCGDDGDPAPDAGAADGGSDGGAVDGGAPDAGPALIVLPDEREPCADRDPLRRPYFGDLHAHTRYSFDAAAYDVRAEPGDAYRFARGEEVGLPPYDARGEPTRRLRLRRPLDFAAVTDHSEFLAETSLCNDETSPGYDSYTCTSYREADVRNADYGDFGSSLALSIPRRPQICRADPSLCAGELDVVWRRTLDAAEAHYDRTAACSFTTFVAYEWTGSAGGNNIHRNVVFRGRTTLSQPLSYIDEPDPEAMLRALDAVCNESASGCEVLSIPHNSNLGAGNMFSPETDGVPWDAEQAALFARLEPLVEVYQHKGSSECLVGPDDPLASEDELCAFEYVHDTICEGGPEDPEGCTPLCSDSGGGIGFLRGCVEPREFVRGALRTGLEELERVGVDPFELGFIGSSDTHNAIPGATDEATWPGHLGDSEDEAAERLDPDSSTALRGRTTSPGGLAVIWAEENSREALFEGLRRRETYGTSGTRITLRVFAGWDYPADLCDRTDRVAEAYAGGVPMGARLPPRPEGAGAPTFFVSAMRDAESAPLQRLQLVKGWIEGGVTREVVLDVAGDADNGATVDPATCARAGDDAGFGELCVVVSDPDFDPDEPAFYYVRVLENPTCRWSQHLCNEAGVDCGTLPADDPLRACCDGSLEVTVQERAWSSPIYHGLGE